MYHSTKDFCHQELTVHTEACSICEEASICAYQIDTKGRSTSWEMRLKPKRLYSSLLSSGSSKYSLGLGIDTAKVLVMCKCFFL